jgi:hypothetical protein
MAAMDQHDGVLESSAGRRAWRFSLSWTALILIGILVYECTSQPALAAAIACAKFAWADIKAAFWLRRVDPDRSRGIACFWGYLTFGLWKTAVMATCVIALLGFLNSLIDPKPRPGPNNGPSPVLGGALATAAIGFGLSFPTAYVALWHALRRGVRVWLGSAPHRARLGRFWPPRHGQVNFAPYVAFTTLIITVWFAVVVFIGLMVAWQPRGPAGIGVSLVLLIGFIASVFTLCTGLATRIFARTPQECWPIEPGESAYQAPEGTDINDRFNGPNAARHP